MFFAFILPFVSVLCKILFSSHDFYYSSCIHPLSLKKVEFCWKIPWENNGTCQNKNLIEFFVFYILSYVLGKQWASHIVSNLWFFQGRHDCVSIINNFVDNEQINYYTRKQGKEGFFVFSSLLCILHSNR